MLKAPILKALIVDDEELARRGMEIRLEKFDDIEICAQSRNGREALEAVREHAPDIMLAFISRRREGEKDIVYEFPKQASGSRHATVAKI